MDAPTTRIPDLQTHLRTVALHRACDDARGADVKDIVERAEAYLAFLSKRTPATA